LFGFKNYFFYALSATAVKNVKGYRRQRLNFLPPSPTALKNFKRRRLKGLKLFSDVGDSAKKYKSAIFKPLLSKF
jgi:hypothetical protein